jgi:outer membrane protein
MTMIKNALIGIAFVAGIAGLVVSMYNRNTKLVYIEMGKAYSEFTLSKELNKELEKVLSARKAITDSLYENLRRETANLKFKSKKTVEDIEKLSKLEEEYYYKQKLFETENRTTTADYETKIWSQINQYVKDYGEANHCTFIFGANGQGNIMYANGATDITTEVLTYLNQRYSGIVNK